MSSTQSLPTPDPCPVFLPVIVNDSETGTPTTYFIECVRAVHNDDNHRAANADRLWTNAEGRVRHQ